MRLTRKKAIELCIELWTWLAKTGKSKKEWPKWEKYKDIENSCWFCEYASRTEVRYKYVHGSCHYCPLIRKLGLNCSETFYYQWDRAETTHDNKKYAKLFLAQLKQIK